MIDPFSSVALGMTANAFSYALGHLKERITPKDREFAKDVAGHLRRNSQYSLDSRTIRSVLFQQETFLALCKGASDEEWDHFLFDLIAPGSPLRGRDLAPDLTAAFRAVASRDLVIVTESLRQLYRLDESQTELKDGQSYILSEIERLSGEIQASIEQLPRESAQVSESVAARMRALDVIIEELTEEQLYVIRHLHGVRRALIPGASGSGKTIVASEKALRLDRAGLRTMLLCHNPNLAEHLSALTAGSTVAVRTFGDWVADYIERQSGHHSTPNEAVKGKWSHHFEPSQSELEQVLDELLNDPPGWDAIVVDEGQDFREDWWQIIDAGLVEGVGILYIFADDDQRILDHREYMQMTEVHSLSKNCRNYSGVYRVMRHLVRGLPAPDPRLEGGSFTAIAAPNGLDSEILEQTIGELSTAWRMEDLVILTPEGREDHFVNSIGEVALSPRRQSWQRMVELVFDSALHGEKWLSHLTNRDFDYSNFFEEERASLSANIYPTVHDVEAVRQVAGLFAYLNHWPTEDLDIAVAEHSLQVVQTDAEGWHFASDGGMLAIVGHLARGSWLEFIDLPKVLTVARGEFWSSPVKVFSIPAFKGLEANHVLVLWESGASAAPATELYVALSRARINSALIVPTTDVQHLPGPIRSLAKRRPL